jgi:hypothetical protein
MREKFPSRTVANEGTALTDEKKVHAARSADSDGDHGKHLVRRIIDS